MFTIHVQKIEKDAEGKLLPDAQRLTKAGKFVRSTCMMKWETRIKRRYVLNKIAIQKMFEGEMDDWDEDEEYD